MCAARTAAITSRANRSRSCAPLVVAVVGQPGQELAHQAVLAGVDLDAVASGARRPVARARRTRRSRRRCRPASIHFGVSRLLTSGTRDGAHSGSWLYALLPCPPAWSSEAIDERAVRVARVGDRLPSGAQRSSERRAFVRPVAVVHARALGDDDAAAAAARRS